MGDTRLLRGLAAGGLVLGVGLVVDALVGDARPRFRGFGVGVGSTIALAAALALWCRAARPVLRRLAVAAVGAMLALVALEVGARAAGVRGSDEPPIVFDPDLGQVLAKGHPGADARGFRNLDAVTAADVVLVGDSQTYGFGLPLAASLPARVAAATGQRCYGMAVGGYGPVQYRLLARRALDLAPRAVVVVFYLGNDIADAHRFAGLRSAESVRTPGSTYASDPTDAPAADARPKPAPNLTVAALEWAARHSRVVDRASYEARTLLKGSGALQGLYGDDRAAVTFDDDRIGTKLTPAYRLQALDATLTSVQDGLQVTGRCIADLAQAVGASGVRLLLVVLPTKEATYHALLRERGGDAQPLAALADAEQRAAEGIGAAAVRADVEVLLAQPLLLDALRNGHAPWPRIADGHLTAAGVELLAGAIAAWLRR